MKERKKIYFPITYISREDIVLDMKMNREYDLAEKAKKLTNAEMQWIADKIGDTFVDVGGFWESARYFSEDVMRRL